MKKARTLYEYTQLLLACLSFTVISASIFQNPLSTAKSPLLNAYATKSGTIPLMRDEFGFYADIDIASHSSDASDTTPDPDTIRVMLALYSPKTILTSNCLNFSNYTCNYPTCNPFTGSNTSIDYLDFTGQGYTASALVYLDYNHWILNDFVTIFTSCSANTSTLYGRSREGIVGLGANNTASNMNFLHSPLFSIFIAPNLWSGELMFFSDMTKVAEGTLGTRIYCDGNWRVITNKTNDTMEIANLTFPLNAVILFDINSDILGFPIDIFDSVIKVLNDTAMECTDSYLKPVCDYNGSINDLPSILLNVGENQTITIPPQVYVENAANQTSNVSSVVLNIKALSSNMSGLNYVTPNYAGSIILDINFMSYFYVVFNSTEQAFLIYTAGQGSSQGSGGTSSWIYVVIGIVALIVVVGSGLCIYYYFYKKKKIRVNPEGLLNKTEEVNVNTETSPLYE